MGGLLACVAAAAVVFVGLLLPPGLALVRLLRIEASGVPRLCLGLGLGYSALMPILFLTRAWPAAAVALPIAVASLVYLRPRPAEVAHALRRHAASLLAPTAMALLAVVVNGRDLVATPDGLSLGLGFDVSDRLFYAAVAQELGRAGAGTIENPVFAGLPLQYAFFPCVLGALVHATTLIPMLPIFLVALPAVCLAFATLAVQGLLEDWGVGSRATRAWSAVLVVLGGDLSFLVPRAASAMPERFSHFFVFYSFSGECLFYNPWMLGVPLLLVALLLLRRYLANGTAGSLVGTALVLGLLWQTKAFAFLALVAACLAYGLVARRLRPLLAAGASALVAAPWLLTALGSGGARDGAPLAPAFLYLVRASLAADPRLQALGDSHAGLLAYTLLFLVGGMGLRLLGLRRLVAEARRSASGLHGIVLATLLVLVLAGLGLEGNPTRLEGVQFLLLAQSLLWLYAGPALVDWGGSGGRLRRAASVALMAVAMITPVGYAARKALPERFTSAGSTDRERYRVPAETLQAIGVLTREAAPGDRVLLPIGASAADPFGERPLLVAALSGRRVLGHAAAFHVGVRTANARLASLELFYATEDASEAESLLGALGAGWVWEDASRPLRFASKRLELRLAQGALRLYRVRAP